MHQHHPPIPLISGDNILLNPSYLLLFFSLVCMPPLSTSFPSLSNHFFFSAPFNSSLYGYLFPFFPLLSSVSQFLLPTPLFIIFWSVLPFCSSFHIRFRSFFLTAPLLLLVSRSSFFMLLFPHQSLVSSSHLLVFSLSAMV